MLQDPSGVEANKLHNFLRNSGGTVLEIGCGDGRATALISPYSENLVAIDSDRNRLNKAMTRLPEVKFIECSGECLCFQGGTFDKVLFTFSLHHMNPRKALAEAHRVLKPGGSALVMEPANSGIMHSIFRVFRNEDDALATVIKAISKSDFHVWTEESFSIEYIFEDVEDVVSYFYSDFQVEREHGLTQRIIKAVGQAASSKPIRLLENVNAWVLSKDGNK